MTIKMIVDECDKYELPDITDTFSFNFSTADSWVRSIIVSGREGGGGSLRGSGLNQTNSMSFFTTFNIYIEHSRFGVGGPNKCINTISNGIAHIIIAYVSALPQ
jgi:hypothetical protein